MAELLPCPFCGGTEIYAEVSYLTKEFRIYCANADEPCVAEMRLSFTDAGLDNGDLLVEPNLDDFCRKGGANG